MNGNSVEKRREKCVARVQDIVGQADKDLKTSELWDTYINTSIVSDLKKTSKKGEK